MKRIVIFFILNLLFNTFCLESISGSQEDKWLDSLKIRGIALENSILEQLKDNPTGFKKLRHSISKKYSVLLGEIQTKRKSLSTLYQKSDNQSRERIVSESEKILMTIIVKLITPLWVGGEWDFNGVPGKKPDLSKPVACGHFVQKVLSDSGFNIKRNKGTWLGYLSPKNFVKSFIEIEPKQHTTWESVFAEIQNQGKGLYLLGLECGWGHVLLGRYFGKKELLLIHSGPHPGGASVNYDDGKSYISGFCGEKIWIVKIGHELIEKWLLNKPIKPCVVM